MRTKNVRQSRTDRKTAEARRLTKEYVELLVRMIVEKDDRDPDARVPNQLLSPKDLENEAEENGKDDERKDEFSACGAVAGFTAPLGAGRQDTVSKKKK